MEGMYDVFLSHNRRQKPWVRCLFHFLESQGLRVFFDEESIAPGENIIAAIERALERSRHVLLVVSPSSLESKWVALEAELAVHVDLDASKGTLVPVIIEPVDFSHVRPSVRSLSCVDLTDPTTREDRLRSVLHHVGVSQAYSMRSEAFRELLSPLSYGAGKDVGLQVVGIQEILDWGWDGVRLLDEFIALDYMTIDELAAAHEGTSRQWVPVFMNHPDTWRMLVSGREQIRGYWHFAPLFPEDYQLAKNGTLLDSQITADRVRLFELPGHYELYFCQVCLHPRFRRPQNVRLLFASIFEVIESLAGQGILIPELSANAYTAVGRALCKSFNMRYVCDHSEHGSIYAAPVSAVLQSTIASSFPRLLAAYSKAGLVE